MAKPLIMYYTWSNGNTERVAERLAVAAEAAGADVDLVRLETVEPYPEDYDETVELGRREVEEGCVREIVPPGVAVADYDAVAVGTPTWWYTMAPAVRAFLEGEDWEGVTVVPFMTNGGWPGTVIEDVEDACAGASFGPSLEVRFDSQGGSHMETPRAELDAWAREVAALVAGR